MSKLWKRIVNTVHGVQSTNENQNKLSQEETLKKDNNAKTRALFLEILFYTAFLVLLLITSYNNKDARAFGYTVSILKDIDPSKNFSKITTSDLMWNWTQSSLISFLNNGLNRSDDKRVSNMASYKLGPIRLRQHRVRDGSCPVHNVFGNLTLRCSPFWSSEGRDWTNYGKQWTPLLQRESALDDVESDVPLNMTVTGLQDEDSLNISSAWIYQTWADIGGLPITGNLGLYPPGGYVLDIVGFKDDATIILRQLQDNQWVDNRTRVVFIEVTLYSPNVNLFAMVTAMFEFPQAEVIMSYIHVHPFRLFVYLGNYSTFVMVCDYLVYAATFWFLVREVSMIYRQRIKYFLKFWNILEFANVIAAIAAIVLHVGRNVIIHEVSKEAKKATGQFYNFQTLARWDEVFCILLASVCFMSIIQMLHILRFNKRMSMLGATMMRSASDLWSFSLVFFLVLFAFVSFSNVLFGILMKSYMTLFSAFESVLLIALGQMEYELMNDVSRVFTPAFILMYALFIGFILLNMLVTILMDAFAEVREDVHKQPNDHELIDYIVATATSILWNYSPFRVLWAVGSKIGLISNSEPASTRKVTTPATEQMCECQKIRKHSVPSLPKRKESGSEATLNKQLLLLHSKLDKLTEEIGCLLRMEGVDLEMVQMEIVKDTEENVIRNAEGPDNGHVFLKENTGVCDEKGDIKLRGDNSSDKEAPIIIGGVDKIDLNGGKHKLCTFPTSHELDIELQDMFSNYFIHFPVDQQVPPTGLIYTGEDNSDLSTSFSVVPDITGKENNKKHVGFQMDVVAEIHSDDSWNSSSISGGDKKQARQDGGIINTNDIPLDIIRPFGEEQDDYIYLSQSRV